MHRIILMLFVLLALCGCNKPEPEPQAQPVAKPAQPAAAVPESATPKAENINAGVIKATLTRSALPNATAPTESIAYDNALDAWCAIGLDGTAFRVSKADSDAYKKRWAEGKVKQYPLPNGTRCELLRTGIDGHNSIAQISVDPGQGIDADLVLYMWSNDLMPAKR